MENINVRLNRNYNNDFLVTQAGLIFYKKDNTLNKDETVLAVSLNDFEARQLINQKILVIVDKKVEETVKKAISKLDDESNKGQTTKNNLVVNADKNVDKEKSSEAIATNDSIVADLKK